MTDPIFFLNNNYSISVTIATSPAFSTVRSTFQNKKKKKENKEKMKLNKSEKKLK